MPHVSENATRLCDKCGKTRRAIANPFKPGTWFFPPRCQCEVDEFDRQEKLRLAKEEQDRLDKLFGMFKLPERFVNRRIENFSPDPGSQKAYEAAKRYIEHLSEHVADGAGVWLEGDNGNGKTHLAASIYHAARDQRTTSVFVVVPDYLKRIQQTYNRKAKTEFTDWQLIDPLRNAKLVVLDDIGEVKPSDWAKEMLFTIVNHRYEWKLATIITTNKDADVLVDILGKATVDRLTGMCCFVENLGDSRRLGEAPTV